MTKKPSEIKSNYNKYKTKLFVFVLKVFNNQCFNSIVDCCLLARCRPGCQARVSGLLARVQARVQARVSGLLARVQC